MLQKAVGSGENHPRKVDCFQRSDTRSLVPDVYCKFGPRHRDAAVLGILLAEWIGLHEHLCRFAGCNLPAQLSAAVFM